METKAIVNNIISMACLKIWVCLHKFIASQCLKFSLLWLKKKAYTAQLLCHDLGHLAIVFLIVSYCDFVHFVSFYIYICVLKETYLGEV